MLKKLIGLAVALVWTMAASQSSACADIALVLAVDGSGSITDDEYKFQKSAIAAAFRDDDVLAALRNAGVVAVSAVFWGDGEFSTQKLEWFVIESGNGAEPFALAMEANRRKVFGNTDIGNGIWSALDMLSDPRFCAAKTIINVSGDGKETIAPKRRPTPSLYQARQRAMKTGTTVNGLVISDEEPDLPGYYERRVILGDDAFVIEVRRFADYSAAIRKKLIRELSPPTEFQLAEHRQ
ncbi:hypothetical protein J2W42_005396 [Rhizobium tibeticum]|uniref:VWFA domain-containing protein n=1 Tax=Rhizobium tibeticum TaxID=501024 RepID=A0A1H8UBZ3_9HYPH|nr:DUF1194 domain-containing protein [Rhizobium tibeticum]MDP9812526.1 hypothetical protein [Rhizobium tibeticum]SEI16999.1 hypothetical protein RTCCBAU85039_5542 [Rhizobium tibeticum]SEP00739.1 Protein of unknown function [Rhizobium tibeticum]